MPLFNIRLADDWESGIDFQKEQLRRASGTDARVQFTTLGLIGAAFNRPQANQGVVNWQLVTMPLTPPTRSFPSAVPRLDYRPAGDEAIDDHDDGYDEKQMDQAAAHVHYEEPENPQDEKNYRDGPEH
jgi:hypothetical protein